MMNSRHDDAWHSSSSLITYIGYITGPRAEQPVGVRVVEPPPGTRQHQRGNLYAVVELSGEHPDRAAIADRLLTDMQRAYYVSKGSQSQVMVEALQQAQQSLREVNAHSPYFPLQAGLLCAALLNGKLLVATSGSAFALVRASDKVHMFPSEVSLSGGGYGLSAAPVEIFRQDVKADDAFFVGGGGWLRRVPIRTLASIVAFTSAETCNDAADELFDQGGQVPLPGLLIVLATNHEPPRPGMPPPGPGSAPPRPRRPRFGGLPTSLGAAPPARMSSPLPRARPSAPPSAERYSSTTLSPPQTAPATPPPSTAFSPTAHASAPLAEPVARPAVQPLSPPEPVAEPQPAPPVEVGPEESRLPSPSPDEQPAASSVEPVEEAPSGPGWTEQLGAAASSAFAQARRFLVQMLPDRQVVEEQPDYSALTPGLEVETEAAESPPSRARHLETAIELETPVRAPSPAVPAEQEQARAGMDEPAVMPTPVLDLPPFTPPQPARGARARLFLLLALVIALLVPAVVAATYLIEGYDREAQAAQLTDAAEAQLVAAQAALDMGDKAAARQQLTEAQDFLNQAIELAGLTERRSQLLAAIETELQQVLQVVLLYGLTEPLITFPPEARPQRILVEGEDIFVLDTGRQAVYQYRVDAATGLVADQAGLVVLQQDHVVDGVPVGSLADMAWLPLIPGYEDRPSLLIADRNNNIFRYDQRVEGATLLPLAGQNRWVSIGQIETYETRIYIADEGGGALYRYEGGQYNVPAENWFSPGTQVNLTGMISLAIDGDVWFLVNNGMILRYRTGEQVPFSPENSIGLAEEPVDLYVGRKELENIYLVDAGEDRILVYDKNGAYLSQLVAPERDLLRGLSAMTIDEVSGTMYLLTQGGVFTHPVVQ